MSVYKHYPINRGCEAWMYPTAHGGFVTIKAVLAISCWQSYPPVMFTAWRDMLNKGMLLDNNDVLTSLESLGAHVSFSYAHGHILWSVRCLTQDVIVVYPLMHELLFSVSYTQEDICWWKTFKLNALRGSLSDTHVQAGILASQAVYSPGHPMYRQSSEEYMQYIQSLQDIDIHDALRTLKLHSMRVCIVGDIDVDMHKKALSQWKIGAWSEDAIIYPPVIRSYCQYIHKEIADKASVFVRIVYALGITMDDADYWPLVVAVDALGGSFSARLMQTIRNTEGLTYGVYSHIQDIAHGEGGYFSTALTLAPQYLARGIALTLAQIKKWHREGLTEQELITRKNGLIGGHMVWASSTKNRAQAMRYGVMYGGGVSYMENYMHQIERVRLQDVNAAIKKWIDPEQCIVISVGTSPGNKE